MVHERSGKKKFKHEQNYIPQNRCFCIARNLRHESLTVHLYKRDVKHALEERKLRSHDLPKNPGFVNVKVLVDMAR